MYRDTNALIDELTAGLEPVRPLRLSSGLRFALAGLAVTLAVVALLFGIRGDVLAGRLDPVFLLSAGLFFVLGLAASVTVIVMSRPQVGRDHGGWRWAAAMTALLPLSGIITWMVRGPDAVSAATVGQGLECAVIGSMLGLLTFAVLTFWLRRGAPTSPERAGLLTGVAAGSFGIFALSLHCPFSDVVHVGLWHSLAVVVSAGLGRLVLPRLIRW
ncbi:NrsF family protein [Pelagerythrobacter aerophilus]|uniref:DUF1109 domain-containing protein n=1 Tax=Pelagerythrobacter aerophilus TaxID=2306995 RepID=A0A418NMG2_9SPHN|nr:DUF1109 domain-containing protein [Pelagerythrobacter aerophilus]RIV81575.1 DUF1109 domain-containing protein [Pelagerythrobacter aerophilus]